MGKVKETHADNLEMLKDLYDRGSIPREEYENRRRSLVNDPNVWSTEPCFEFTAPPVAIGITHRGESAGM